MAALKRKPPQLPVPWPINVVVDRLDAMSAKLDQILANEAKEMATISDIQAAVTAEKTVEDSVVALLTQLAADLKAALAANDPAAAQAIVDQITANTAALASAVTANTPAA